MYGITDSFPDMGPGNILRGMRRREDLTQEQRQHLIQLFSILGQAHVLPEKDFDAFTALVGCGPAYVFYFMDALIEAGVLLGLQRKQATDMVHALFAGATKMAEATGMHVKLLREMVTSPGGSTIRALATLDGRAVRGAIVEAVRTAAARNRELGG